MADVGYAVEYIVRVLVQGEGSAGNIPVDGTMAVNELSGRSALLVKGGGDSIAKSAQSPPTNIYFNAGLKIGMPLFNALTDGVAGNVVSTTRKFVSFGSALASGASVGGVIGAGATLVGWGVSELINDISADRAANQALADRLDDTNFIRQMAGLDKIDYTQSGIRKKITVKETR